MIRALYRMLSLLWMVKAVAKGPGSAARYAVRQQARKAVNRNVIKMFRKSKLL
jgi:hypothetical protein